MASLSPCPVLHYPHPPHHHPHHPHHHMETIGPQIGCWWPLSPPNPMTSWSFHDITCSWVEGIPLHHTVHKYTSTHTHKYKNSKVSKYTYMKNDRRKSKILWYQEHIEIHCTFGFWYLISSSLYCICNRKHWRGDIGIWACASPRLGIWHRPDQDNRDTCSKSNINEQRLNQFRAYDCMNVSLASDDIKTFIFIRPQQIPTKKWWILRFPPHDCLKNAYTTHGKLI